MAKNMDTEQERIEQEFRNHINEIAKERTGKLQEQFNEAFTKAAESAKRNRQRKLAREFFRCGLFIGAIIGLYLAESAGMISAVLAGPVYAIAFASLGWHLCKIDRLRGRK